MALNPKLGTPDSQLNPENKIVSLRPDLGTRQPDHQEIWQSIKDVDPTKVAEAQTLSQQLGRPYETVEPNLAEARHTAKMPNFEELKDSAPALYEQLQNPAFAALVKDDIQNLMTLEQQIREQTKVPELSLSRVGRKASASFKQSIADAAKANSAYWDGIDVTNPKDQEEAIRTLTFADKPKYYERKQHHIGSGEPEQMAIALALRDIKEGHQNYWKGIADDPDLQIPADLQRSSGVIEDVVAAMAGSATGMALSAVNPPAGTAFFFNQMYGSKYRELVSKGVDADLANQAAMISALGQAPLESAGSLLQLGLAKNFLTGLAGRVGFKIAETGAVEQVSKKGLKALAAELGTVLLEAGAGEGFEEYLQTFPDVAADLVAQNPNATTADIVAMFIDKVPETAMSKDAAYSALIGALSGVGFTGATITVGTPVSLLAAQSKAKALRKKIEALQKQFSSLQDLDRDAFEAYVQKVAGDSNMESIFFQGDVLHEALNQAGQNIDVWAKRMGITKEQILEAATTGQDLGIDAGKVIASLKDDDVIKSLVDEMKIQPDDVALAKLGVEGENAQAANTRLRELYNESIVNEATPEQITVLEKQIQEAASQAGLTGFNQQAVKQQAALVLSGARSWASRMTAATGRTFTVDDFFTMFNLSISSPAPVADNPISNSVVVDAAGQPIPVYHGRAGAEAVNFGERHAMFSPSEEYATDIAGEGGTVVKRFINIRKPANLNAMKISPSDPNFDQVVEDLKAKGFDGAFYGDMSNPTSRGNAWIVFSPGQIFEEDQVHIAPDFSRDDTGSITVDGVIYDQVDQAEEFSKDDPVLYQVSKKSPPKKTVIAYKLFRTDPRFPGKLFPLFVNADQEVPIGEWLEAEEGPMTNEGKVKSKLGPLAYRPGWHAGDVPIATHIGEFNEEQKQARAEVNAKRLAEAEKRGWVNSKGKISKANKKALNKEFPYPDWAINVTLRPSNHVWAEVEMSDDVDWQSVANERGTNAKGKVVAGKAAITDQIPVGGHYRYKTNPNMTGNWLIGGEVKVNRILTDDEVLEINNAAGVEDLQRLEPVDLAAMGFVDRVVASLNQSEVGVTDEVDAFPAPDTFYQVHPDSQQKWKQATVEWMRKNGYTEQDITRQLESMEGQMKIFEALGPMEIELFPHSAGLVKEKAGKRGTGGPFRSNADPIYKITFDASAMCVKRLEAATTAAEIQKRLGRALTTSERMALVSLFQMQGKLSPCIYCYVEAPRAKQAEFVQKGIEIAMGSRQAPKKWSQTMRLAAAAAAEQVKALGIKQEELDVNLFVDPDYLKANFEKAQDLFAKAPAVYDFINKAGLAAKANLPKLYEEYNGQIMQMPQELITELNGYAGMRFFSSSDFQVEHVADLMQAFVDLSLRLSKAHAYTKVPMFISIFGDTGMKIQASIFAKKDANGNIVQDGHQGMDWDQAQRFRSEHDHVGTVLVATSDEILQWGLDQDWIDYVIPFHFSGLEKKFYGTLEWEDFTSTQSEKFIADPNATEKRDRSGKIRMHDIGTAKGMTNEEATRAYLELALERKIIPVFPSYIFIDGQQPAYGKSGKLLANQRQAINKREKQRWIDMVEKGEIDWSVVNPNYFKLKKDYARTDTPFNPVQANFNQEALAEALESFLAGNEPKAQVDNQIIDKFLQLMKKYKGKADIGIELLKAVNEGRTFFQGDKAARDRKLALVAQLDKIRNDLLHPKEATDGIELPEQVQQPAGQVQNADEDARRTQARDLFTSVGFGNEAIATGAIANELLYGIQQGEITVQLAVTQLADTLNKISKESREAYDALLQAADHLRDMGYEIPEQIGKSWTMAFMNAIGDAYVLAEVNAEEFFQSAFHGTPHEVDRFSTEKIGTGEGAQAYGWGLYFASNKAVAQWYRDRLAARRVLRTSFGEFDSASTPSRPDFSELFFVQGWTKYELAAGILFATRGDLQEAKKRVDQLSQVLDISLGFNPDAVRDEQTIRDTIEFVKSLNDSDIQGYQENTGKIYHVELAPTDDEYLLWHEDLHDQSDHVKDALFEVLERKADGPEERTNGLVVPWERFLEDVKEAVDGSYPMTGEELYSMLTSDEVIGYTPEQASRLLHSVGIRGIKYIDGMSRNNSKDSFNFVIFDQEDVSITDFEQRRQRQGGVVRGSITFSDKKDSLGANIKLTTDADLSTFLHESGHFFLEVARRTALQHGVLVEEWNAIKDFLGATDDKPLTRDQHEKWAEAFERYLSEGVAPSLDLRSAFDSFKKWLVNVYRGLTNVPGQQITDEIRNVMDKLLATDQEITDARAAAGLFSILDEQAKQKLGKTDPELLGYLQTMGLTDDQAARALDLYRLKDLKRRTLDNQEKAGKEWEKLTSTKAIKFLIENGGLNREEFLEAFGQDALDGMPKNVGIFRKESDGVLAAVAREFDLSEQDMLDELLNHEKKGDYVDRRVQELEQEHDAGMTGQDALHSTSALKDQLATESALLARLAQIKRVLENRQIRAFAEEIVGKMTPKQLRDINKTITALRRARLAANKAVQHGDYAKAFHENEKARLNEAIIQAQTRAKDRMTKIANRWGRIFKAIRKNPGNYDADFRDQIARLITRFGLSKTGIQVEKEVSLLDFFEKLNMSIPATYEEMMDLTAGTFGTYEWLYDEVNNKGTWQDLNFTQLEEVDDLMVFLFKEGRLDKREYLADGVTKIQDVVDELTEYVMSVKDKKKLGEFDTFLKAKKFIRKYGAEHIPLQYFLARMDGYDTSFGGKNIQWLFNPLSKAAADEHLIIQQMHDHLKPVIAALHKSAKKHPRILRHASVPLSFTDPSNSDVKSHWTFDKVISFALNFGNKDNLQKLLDGYEMSYEQALQVVSILTKSDWQNIQKIWDAIDLLWPETARVHRILHGFTPKKIKSEAFTIQTSKGPVELQGGYYPLKFDPKFSSRQEQQNEKADIMQAQNSIYPSTKTPQGFTIARSETAGKKPVWLSMAVLTDHISHVAHHVTHAIPLNDIDKITKSKDYKAEVIRAFGKDMYDLIRPSLAHIANPKTGGIRMSLEELVDKERMRAAAYILWYNVSVAAKQPFSLANLAQAMGGIGSARYILPEMIKMTNPVHWYTIFNNVNKLSPNMARRAKAIDRELQKPENFGALRKLTGTETVGQALDKFSDATGPLLIRLMDLVAAYPGWMAAYRKGLDMHKGDADLAIAYADNVISATQPFDRPLDKNGIRRATGMTRFWSMFTGYTTKYAARRSFYLEGFRSWIATRGKTGIGPVEFVSHVGIERVAPALVMTFVIGWLMHGEPPEPEDYLVDLLLFQFAGRIGVQDVAAAMAAMARGGRQRSVLESPIATGADLTVDQVRNIKKGFEKGEESQAIIEAFWKMLEYYKKIPISRAVDKAERIAKEHSK